MQTNVPWLFTAGDVRRGAATVVEAICDGRKAAGGIHQFLQGEAVAPQTVVEGAAAYHVGEAIINLTDPSDIAEVGRNTARARMRELNVEQRRANFDEVELGLLKEVAHREAQRCLDCGLICYQHNAGESDDQRSA
ncbi:MAG: hypothetical protein QGH45_14355, partial [Myxococcota bacterium]|nr:hypothetical protein [Myxococcota bacterium]